MSRTQNILLAAAALIIIGTAYVHGTLTDRWTKRHSEKLSEYTLRLDSVPTEFGDWTSVSQEVNAEEFKASGCDGHFSRLFTNKVTNEQISVFLVSGRGYHVTIHTPNFCYKAAGYEQQQGEVSYLFEAGGMPEANEVVHALFKKDTATETSHLRILWTFCVDQVWKSPSSPKFAFGGEDAMYKMYLIRGVKDGVPPIGEDPSVKFAKEFLPLVNQTLFPADAAATASDSEAAVAE